MVVFLHVIVALLGMMIATLSLFSPTKVRLVVAYSLIVATIGSGVYLVWLMPSKMLHVCVAGVVYIVITGAITLTAQVRLVKAAKGII